MVFWDGSTIWLEIRALMSQATPHEHIVFTEFDGAEGILVDLNTKKYYQLNETATVIWNGIANGAPIVEIANNLVDSYEVTPEDAQRNVQSIVQQFRDYKLIGID
jgi:hypothetical protein